MADCIDVMFEVLSQVVDTDTKDYLNTMIAEKMAEVGNDTMEIHDFVDSFVNSSQQVHPHDQNIERGFSLLTEGVISRNLENIIAVNKLGQFVKQNVKTGKIEALPLTTKHISKFTQKFLTEGKFNKSEIGNLEVVAQAFKDGHKNQFGLQTSVLVGLALNPSTQNLFSGILMVSLVDAQQAFATSEDLDTQIISKSAFLSMATTIATALPINKGFVQDKTAQEVISQGLASTRLDPKERTKYDKLKKKSKTHQEMNKLNRFVTKNVLKTVRNTLANKYTSLEHGIRELPFHFYQEISKVLDNSGIANENVLEATKTALMLVTNAYFRTFDTPAITLQGVVEQLANGYGVSEYEAQEIGLIARSYMSEIDKAGDGGLLGNHKLHLLFEDDTFASIYTTNGRQKLAQSYALKLSDPKYKISNDPVMQKAIQTFPALKEAVERGQNGRVLGSQLYVLMDTVGQAFRNMAHPQTNASFANLLGIEKPADDLLTPDNVVNDLGDVDDVDEQTTLNIVENNRLSQYHKKIAKLTKELSDSKLSPDEVLQAVETRVLSDTLVDMISMLDRDTITEVNQRMGRIFKDLTSKATKEGVKTNIDQRSKAQENGNENNLIDTTYVEELGFHNPDTVNQVDPIVEDAVLKQAQIRYDFISDSENVLDIVNRVGKKHGDDLNHQLRMLQGDSEMQSILTFLALTYSTSMKKQSRLEQHLIKAEQTFQDNNVKIKEFMTMYPNHIKSRQAQIRKILGYHRLKKITLSEKMKWTVADGRKITFTLDNILYYFLTNDYQRKLVLENLNLQNTEITPQQIKAFVHSQGAKMLGFDDPKVLADLRKQHSEFTNFLFPMYRDMVMSTLGRRTKPIEANFVPIQKVGEYNQDHDRGSVTMSHLHRENRIDEAGDLGEKIDINLTSVMQRFARGVNKEQQFGLIFNGVQQALEYSKLNSQQTLANSKEVNHFVRNAHYQIISEAIGTAFGFIKEGASKTQRDIGSKNKQALSQVAKTLMGSIGLAVRTLSSWAYALPFYDRSQGETLLNWLKLVNKENTEEYKAMKKQISKQLGDTLGNAELANASFGQDRDATVVELANKISDFNLRTFVRFTNTLVHHGIFKMVYMAGKEQGLSNDEIMTRWSSIAMRTQPSLSVLSKSNIFNNSSYNNFVTLNNQTSKVFQMLRGYAYTQLQRGDRLGVANIWGSAVGGAVGYTALSLLSPKSVIGMATGGIGSAYILWRIAMNLGRVMAPMMHPLMARSGLRLESFMGGSLYTGVNSFNLIRSIISKATDGDLTRAGFLTSILISTIAPFATGLVAYKGRNTTDIKTEFSAEEQAQADAEVDAVFKQLEEFGNEYIDETVEQEKARKSGAKTTVDN